MNELDTVARYQLPVKVIILNDEGHGMVMQWQERHYGGRHSATNYSGHSPNFAAIARSGYVVKGVKVNEKKDLRPALQEALEYDGPVVLDIRTDPPEHILP